MSVKTAEISGRSAKSAQATAATGAKKQDVKKYMRYYGDSLSTAFSAI